MALGVPASAAVDFYLEVFAVVLVCLVNLVFVYKSYSLKKKFSGSFGSLFDGLGRSMLLLFILQLMFPISSLVIIQTLGEIYWQKNFEVFFFTVFVLISLAITLVELKFVRMTDQLIEDYSFQPPKEEEEGKVSTSEFMDAFRKTQVEKIKTVPIR